MQNPITAIRSLMSGDGPLPDDERPLTIDERVAELEAAGVSYVRVALPTEPGKQPEERLFVGRAQVRAYRQAIRAFDRSRRRTLALAADPRNRTPMSLFLERAREIREPDERQRAQVAAVIAEYRRLHPEVQ